MNKLSKLIKDFNNICIFRHENPDCDALGSQFALKYWIEDNFKDKIVKVCGLETYSKSIFPKSDSVSDDFIKNSLCIVLDTANEARIDDKRYKLSKKIVKIDHHPNIDEFGDVNIVDVNFAATCELLGTMMFSEDYIINERTAKMLYRGILTDTLSFKTNNTTENTLIIASKLVGLGINIPLINQELFNDSLEIFKFKSKLRTKLKINDKVGYITFNVKEIEQSNLKAGDIRGFIYEIGNIYELEAWCIFTEKIEKNQSLYDGSLRSKNIAVNKIAEMYNGGGHKNASGIKNVTKKQIKDIISLLNKEINKCD